METSLPVFHTWSKCVSLNGTNLSIFFHWSKCVSLKETSCQFSSTEVNVCHLRKQVVNFLPLLSQLVNSAVGCHRCRKYGIPLQGIQPGVGQNIALYVLPSARESIILISALLGSAALFSSPLQTKSEVCHKRKSVLCYWFDWWVWENQGYSHIVKKL